MRHPFDAELSAELADLERRGLARSTARVSAGVDFTSNDYLGLARDPAVVAAAREAVEREGAGARAARLLAERLPSHERAEARAAEWLGAEAALLFPSGYQANVGVLGALARRGDLVVSDALNHASLIDAARLSRAAVAVHVHVDLDDVERVLRAGAGARRRIVVTEAVFSMDGTRAPLAALHALCERYDAWLVIDEAHSVGLLGPRGAGAWAEELGSSGADTRLAARVITGGKALGSAGAFVVGRRSLRDLLVNRARSFIFSTAPPPSLAATLAAAIERAADAEDLRERCLAVAGTLAAALDLPPPPAAIVPLVVGDPERAVSVASQVEAAGYAVRAVRPPTVPPGTSRLRLVAHAHNTLAEARAAAAAVRAALGAPVLGAPVLGAPVRPTLGGPPGPPAPPPPPTHPPLTDVRADATVGRSGTAIGGGTLAPLPAFVVAGTDTGVGKTVVSALALAAALRRGSAGYWKPVQTGTDDDTAEVRRLAGAPGSVFVEPLRRYPLPASPHEAAADAGDEFPVEELTPRFDRLRLDELRRDGAADGRARGRTPRLDRPTRHRSDALNARPSAERWIVELAGGLLVPLTEDWLQVDWLQEIRVPVLLVARSGLGTLNHTLLSVEALRARGIPIAALFLVGEPHPSNARTLIERTGIEHVFTVAPLAPLDANAVGAWIDGAVSHRGARLHELLAGAARPSDATGPSAESDAPDSPPSALRARTTEA